MSVMSVSLKQIWASTLNAIQKENFFDDVVYNTYFSTSSLQEFDDTHAIISVPTNIQKFVLLEYVDCIADTLERTAGKRVAVDVLFEGEIPKINEFLFSPESTVIEMKDTILSTYTFDNFVVGDSNKESHAAALACSMHPGKFYNPLFIFGNSGLGKTHLLHSIGNYAKKAYPEMKVHYVSSTDFVTGVVNSIKQNNIDDFKKEMKQVDVLLVDDIQFLAGKEKSHETFFQIFNDLVNMKKQIVLTSDRHPTEINGLEERLISRFSSGLSVNLDSPEFDTSLQILKKKLEHHTVDPSLIDEDVLAYVATNFSSDVRKLEGALNRLIFYSINFSTLERVDLKTAMAAFKGQAVVTDRNDITISTIKKSVADYYGLTRQQLISKSRTKMISTARHIAMFLCRKHLDVPFMKIGEEFGKRDHSTVMSACEKVEKSLSTDDLLKQAVKEIEKAFLGT
jgi:chromosomal replication initiator protein DnaA